MFFDRIMARAGPVPPERALHDAAVAQSRAPVLYVTMGVPDTVDGRYELLTLHVILLLDRLRDVPDVRQALFDIYVSDLDGALREMGVGDLSVGKRMKKLGSAFYGRAQAYDDAFKRDQDDNALEAVIARTVFRGAKDGNPARLAAYMRDSRERLVSQPTQAIITGRIEWGLA